MIHCPICHSDKIVKNGKANHGLQRYLCDSCMYTFTQDHIPKTCPKEKEKIIVAYLKNEEVKKIEKQRKISRTTICSWIRLLKKNIAEIADIKKDTRWQSFELSKLNFLENEIKKNGWTNPLSKKQLTVLHHKNMEALVLLLQYRPRKQKKQSSRKCYKSINDGQKALFKTIDEVKKSRENVSLNQAKLLERASAFIEKDSD